MSQESLSEIVIGSAQSLSIVIQCKVEEFVENKRFATWNETFYAIFCVKSLKYVFWRNKNIHFSKKCLLNKVK